MFKNPMRCHVSPRERLVEEFPRLTRTGTGWFSCVWVCFLFVQKMYIFTAISFVTLGFTFISAKKFVIKIEPSYYVLRHRQCPGCREKGRSGPTTWTPSPAALTRVVPKTPTSSIKIHSSGFCFVFLFQLISFDQFN